MADWHPIRVVAKRTGLSPHVIRAWEKRYGAVTPTRTPTGRRVYSNEDLERLSLLRQATLLGRSIGQIAKVPTEELRSIVEEDEAAVRHVQPVPAARRGSVDADKLLVSCLEATERLDAVALGRNLDEGAVLFSRPVLMEDVIVPLMHRIGSSWREGSLRVAHEHLASAVVRSFVGSFDGAFQVSATAPEVVVTTPAGQLHEIGALLAAATMASEGWNVTYLGPSLPADEIAAAVRSRGARAVALSVVYPTDDPNLRAELQRVTQLVGPEVPVLVGGRGASNYRTDIDQAGALYLPDYQSLRRELEKLREGLA